jgi:hypothetical protein
VTPVASIILNVSGGTATLSVSMEYWVRFQSVRCCLSGKLFSSGNRCLGMYNRQRYSGADESEYALLVGGVLQHANCISGLLGSISLQTSGGTGSYSYLWNNGSTTSGLTGLNSGSICSSGHRWKWLFSNSGIRD